MRSALLHNEYNDSMSGSLHEASFDTWAGQADGPGEGQDGTDGSIPLSPTAVALAAVLLLINVAISFLQGLGLHTQIVIAACRLVWLNTCSHA